MSIVALPIVLFRKMIECVNQGDWFVITTVSREVNKMATISSLRTIVGPSVISENKSLWVMRPHTLIYNDRVATSILTRICITSSIRTLVINVDANLSLVSLSTLHCLTDLNIAFSQNVRRATTTIDLKPLQTLTTLQSLTLTSTTRRSLAATTLSVLPMSITAFSSDVNIITDDDGDKLVEQLIRLPLTSLTSGYYLILNDTRLRTIANSPCGKNITTFASVFDTHHHSANI